MQAIPDLDVLEALDIAIIATLGGVTNAFTQPDLRCTYDFNGRLPAFVRWQEKFRALEDGKIKSIKTSLKEFVPADRARIERLLALIKEFEPEDQALAMELVDYALNQPGQKDYEFVLAEMGDGRLVGYACYGPTPLTDGTFDLYWIAVDPDFAGRGIGTMILRRVEDQVVARNGRLMVIETSSSPQYAGTRLFYLKKRYDLAETIPDFFRKGEDRVTYIKKFRE